MALNAETMQQAFGLLANVYGQQDWIATLLEFLRGAPLCSTGCDTYCRTFRCSDIEAKYVAHNIPNLPKNKKSELIRHLEGWLLQEPREDLGDGRFYPLVVSERCPFLNDDNRCLIYPWRPINCRAWGTTRPATPGCKRPIVEGETESKRMFMTGPEVKMLEAMLQGLVDFMKSQAPSLLLVGFAPGMVYKNLFPKMDPRLAGARTSMGMLRNGMTPWLITHKDFKKKGYKGP